MQSKKIDEKMSYSIVQCRKCAMQYAMNPYTLSEYEKISDSRKQGRLALQQAMTRERIYIWKILDAHCWKIMIEKGNFLDFGCNIGVLLGYARKAGWNTYGVEISQYMVNYCKKKSLKVSQNMPTEMFQVITLVDVLEHLLTPLDILQNLIQHLTNQGVMLISVPITQKGWFLNDTHINYFTNLTLVKFLNKLELEVLHFQFHTNKYGLIVICRKGASNGM